MAQQRVGIKYTTEAQLQKLQKNLLRFPLLSRGEPPTLGYNNMSFDWNAFVKAPDPQLTGNLAGATRERLRVVAAQFQRSVLPE